MAEMEEREDQNARNGLNEEKDMLGEVLGRKLTKEYMGRCPDGQEPMGFKGENEGPRGY